MWYAPWIETGVQSRLQLGDVFNVYIPVRIKRVVINIDMLFSGLTNAQIRDLRLSPPRSMMRDVTELIEQGKDLNIPNEEGITLVSISSKFCILVTSCPSWLNCRICTCLGMGSVAK